jgi:Acetyl-CoA carboxylase beta subunit
MNFNFMGGSVGRAAGEAFVAGAEFAFANKLPYVFFLNKWWNANARIKSFINADAKNDCSN